METLEARGNCNKFACHSVALSHCRAKQWNAFRNAAIGVAPRRRGRRSRSEEEEEVGDIETWLPAFGFISRHTNPLATSPPPPMCHIFVARCAALWLCVVWRQHWLQVSQRAGGGGGRVAKLMLSHTACWPV